MKVTYISRATQVVKQWRRWWERELCLATHQINDKQLNEQKEANCTKCMYSVAWMPNAVVMASFWSNCKRRKWRLTQWTWLPALNHQTESQLPDGNRILRTLHESRVLSLILFCETNAISVLRQLLSCHCVKSAQCVKSTLRESRW